MFYFLVMPYLTYHWILIAAAVIPAIFLMIKVYKSDRLEKEQHSTLIKLVISGILATLIAMVLEWIGETVLNLFSDSQESAVYNIILYFVIVACSEEGAKYLMLKKRTWDSPEFNCQYDAVVYSVFVSLGFALWENISYVLHYGLSTALVRAVTAIPGHMCFGVFMGAFYGLAKGYDYLCNKGAALRCRILAFIVPVLTHGAYDYIVSTNLENGDYMFIVFIIVLFAVSFFLVSRLSRNDKYYARWQD